MSTVKFVPCSRKKLRALIARSASVTFRARYCAAIPPWRVGALEGKTCSCRKKSGGCMFSFVPLWYICEQTFVD